jgi:ABC-type multidrug transport system fused ATPase/permease subunit
LPESEPIQERLGAIRDVKSITAEEYEQKLMYGLLTVQAGQQIRHTFLKRVEQPIRFIVNRAAILVVMLYGAWLLLNEELTIVGFGLFMVFAQNLIGPLGTMAGIAVQVASIEGVMEEVLHLLRQEPEPSGDRPAPAAGPDLIEIENVSFAYGHAPVLDHVSLKIKKGEMVAIIGRSGAGKTTLVNLLLRFYQPCEGAILFDGIPIDEFDLTSYRRLFGVVSQTCTLLDDTVYQNIAYARPDLRRTVKGRPGQLRRQFIQMICPTFMRPSWANEACAYPVGNGSCRRAGCRTARLFSFSTKQPVRWTAPPSTGAGCH